LNIKVSRSTEGRKGRGIFERSRRGKKKKNARRLFLGHACGEVDRGCGGEGEGEKKGSVAFYQALHKKRRERKGA